MMDQPTTAKLIRALDRYLLRSQGHQPPLEWTANYPALRVNVVHLPQYAFCPVFYGRMMGLVAGQLRAGKTVSASMLRTIRAWFNKAKGFTNRQGELYREREVDLKDLLGGSYEAARDASFEVFTVLAFDEHKKRLVASLLNEFELTEQQQQWLVDHWQDDRLVLDKLLQYPYPSAIIGRWAIGKGLEQGVLLPHLDRLVARALSHDPDYLLTIRQVKKLMANVLELWDGLADLYHSGIQGVIQLPAQGKAKEQARQWLQAWDGANQQYPDLLDHLEVLNRLHPNFPHTAFYFPDLLRQGLRFRLFPQPTFLTHLGVEYFMDFPRHDWVAFEIKPFDLMEASVVGQQPERSVRNFYRVFPYVDIEGTVEEWYMDARQIRDEAFYKGIHLSCLPQEKKNALYDRYFCRELQEVLFDIIKKEQNLEMATWLRNRLAKSAPDGIQ